jgi:hypothetical protein
LAVLGCASSTEPPNDSPGPDGADAFSASLDPADGSFVLQRVGGSGPSLNAIRVELVGRNLVVDETAETVSVDVAVRNLWHEPLFSPGIVWVGNFSSGVVSVVNADIELAGNDSTGGPGVPPLPYGFDYSALLGEDGRLDPKEQSEFKTWIFHAPGLNAFGFEARAQFSIEPDRAFISGVVFADGNQNGTWDDGEDLVGGGAVHVAGPEGFEAHVGVREGRYRVFVEHAGLYTLHHIRREEQGEVCFTTPNPLSVLLPPSDEGGPASYDGAHFGVTRCGPGEPKDVVLVDGWPPDVPLGHYRILRAGIEGKRLFVRIVYSGCGGEPGDLYVSTAFAESLPPQTRATFAIEAGDCDAVFEETRVFNLEPLRDAYVDAYGEQGRLIIHLTDVEGTEFELLFEIGSRSEDLR